MTNQVDEEGYCVLDKHAIVTFKFEGLTELQVDGFSPQNVIAGLDVEHIAQGLRMTLAPCYGLAGTLEAKQITVDIVPGKPG
jgi:hypothetical protein